MRFQSLPPAPAELPKIRLLLPAAVPAAIALVAWLADRAGHQWNIHGDAALLMAAFFVSLVLAPVATFVALASIAPAMRQHPTLRSKGNMACIGIAAASIPVAIGLLVIIVRKIAAE